MNHSISIPNIPLKFRKKESFELCTQLSAKIRLKDFLDVSRNHRKAWFPKISVKTIFWDFIRFKVKAWRVENYRSCIIFAWSAIFLSSNCLNKKGKKYRTGDFIIINYRDNWTRRSECECGVPPANLNRIIGGEETAPNQFPWMVRYWLFQIIICFCFLYSKFPLICLKRAKASQKLMVKHLIRKYAIISLFRLLYGCPNGKMSNGLAYIL